MNWKKKYSFLIPCNFKIYKADKVQKTAELDQLALTPKGACRTTSVNYVRESYKQEVKESLTSESGSRLYAQRKIDVEIVFGCMKRNFDVRRVHVRGELEVRSDLGLLLLSMNLMKLAEMIRKEREKMANSLSFFSYKYQTARYLTNFRDIELFI